MKAGGIHYRNTVLALLVAAVAAGHPLGNLSVNRLARLAPGARGVAVDYVLDLGEMPVFELMQRWGVDRAGLKAAAPAHAGEWISGLSFQENGAVLQPELKASEFEVANSPGDLATLRATLHLFVPAKGGRLEFADRNYEARSGWREILIVPAGGAEITRASNGGADPSSQLRNIPEDLAPLNERAAWMEWRPEPAVAAQNAPPVIVPLAAPRPSEPAHERAATAPASSTNPKRSSQTDAISDILRRKNISVPVFITLLALAFWFGALHALEPGHGKTMVAAYLVGARGTPKHAAVLGASVTFTHTASVFLLGVATLFVSRFVMPDRISRVLGVASGISILWIGGMLLWRRIRTLRASAHDHEHHHAHEHDHTHAHDHHHSHDPAHHHHPHDHHPHSHDALTHTHDGHTHTHLPEGDISARSLIALGASGGLVPCPSALILLLTAISLGRTGLGLVLLCAFSAGLAIVLTATGMAVLYAKRLIPERRRSNPAMVRYIPVFSAAVIVIIGAVMTGVSLGWIPAGRFIG